MAVLWTNWGEKRSTLQMIPWRQVSTTTTSSAKTWWHTQPPTRKMRITRWWARRNWSSPLECIQRILMIFWKSMPHYHTLMQKTHSWKVRPALPLFGFCCFNCVVYFLEWREKCLFHSYCGISPTGHNDTWNWFNTNAGTWEMVAINGINMD